MLQFLRHRFVHLTLLSIITSILLLVFFLPVFSANETSDAPTVQLQVSPTSIELRSGETARITIVARNTSAEAVEQLELQWLTNSDLQITPVVTPSLTTLPAQAEIAWDFLITRPDNTNLDRSSETVHFQLNYLWQNESAIESLTTAPVPVPRVVLGELTVNTPLQKTAADIVNITVKSTLTSINEQSPGEIFLLVENKLDVPLQVTDIITKTPEFISLSLPNPAMPLTIQPHETKSVSFEAKADDAVQSGKELLLFELALTWTQGTQAYTLTQVASHEVDVGVFGESPILTLLRIPILALLPGFLMIIAYQFLWSFNKTETEKDAFPLKVNTSLFWFFAIMFSGFMALLYPYITRFLGLGSRNYWQSYGLKDIFILWAASISISILAYIIYNSLRKLCDWCKQRRLAKRTPSANDTALDSIKKLDAQDLTLSRDTINFTDKDKHYKGFLLQVKDTTTATTWVIPPISLERLNDRTLSQEITQILTKKGSDQLQQQKEDIKRFITICKDHNLTLNWDKNWPFDGPQQITREHIQGYSDPETIVGWE